jgi:hypothetical protein
MPGSSVVALPPDNLRFAYLGNATTRDVPNAGLVNAVTPAGALTVAQTQDGPSTSTGSKAGGTEGRSRGPRSGGVGIGFALPGFGSGVPQPDASDMLLETGPQFPEQFSMSCAPVHGFVQGGWPVVVDYQTTGPTRAVLEVHGTATQQPHVVTLERAERRTLVKLNLPQTFGATPQIALYLVRAEKQVANTPGGVQLFGLGAGPRAVGSVAIDQVDFGPSALRVSQKQRASYSFYSRSDFNRVVVEIVRVARAAGEIKVSLARSTPLDITLTRGTWVGKKEPLTWDGMNGANRVSTGPHMLQVRAWLNGQDARDWVAAWSPSAVVVAE